MARSPEQQTALLHHHSAYIAHGERLLMQESEGSIPSVGVLDATDLSLCVHVTLCNIEVCGNILYVYLSECVCACTCYAGQNCHKRPCEHIVYMI